MDGRTDGREDVEQSLLAEQQDCFLLQGRHCTHMCLLFMCVCGVVCVCVFMGVR